MNTHRLLWTLVIADVLLAFASVGAEAFFGWTLPPGLADYRHVRFSGFPLGMVAGAMSFGLVIVTVILAFIAWIGLLSYWRHARRIYVIALATGLLHMLFAGPEVTTSIGAVFRTLDAVIAGALIGLVYFSDLAHRFERGPVPTTAPTTGMNLGASRG